MGEREWGKEKWKEKIAQIGTLPKKKKKNPKTV